MKPILKTHIALYKKLLGPEAISKTIAQIEEGSIAEEKLADSLVKGASKAKAKEPHAGASLQLVLT